MKGEENFDSCLLPQLHFLHHRIPLGFSVLGNAAATAAGF
eukprot:SAG11_NODE_18668_length_484_cov_0.937662_1_plen_39_part_10